MVLYRILLSNAWILLIGPLETNFIEISIKIQNIHENTTENWKYRLRHGGELTCCIKSVTVVNKVVGPVPGSIHVIDFLEVTSPYRSEYME